MSMSDSGFGTALNGWPERAWLTSVLLAGIVLLSGTAVVAQDAKPRQTITIPRIEAPPRLESYLSGEERPGARVTDFLQRSPGDLTAPSEQTDAYLSYDATNLYAVFVCRTTDPSRIRARISRREQMFSDDSVGLFLDTFNDRQRSYMFFSNPLGIQADGVTIEGQGDDLSFDAVWRAEGRVTESGYIVAMTIPFKSLRFPAGTGPQTWGIALRRRMAEKNEDIFWPGITDRIAGFSSQFAEARGLEGVSPGRNIQLIPYGTFTNARFLDRTRPAFDTDNEGRGGLDAKIIVRDAVALDFTLNPDFSQVESDEPQVTVNQRFEVFFPEKRPFFLENANYFQTPITLFFSRRIRDPQFGARSTGKLGGWAVGALAIDDRSSGTSVPSNDPLFGDRASNALAVVRREFGESSVGALVTSRGFGPSSNRVASVDSRLRLNSMWFLTGQAAFSDTTLLTASKLQSTAYAAAINKSGRKLTYSLNYTDIGADFSAPLGFVPRTDIRQALSFATLRWRPKNSPIVALGPNSFIQYTWDQSGVLQDWLVRFPFQVDLKRQSFLFARRAESMERFEGLEFRQHENWISFSTSYLRWMDFFAAFSNGTRPNFYPAEGLAPFLADFRDGQLGLTFRPTSRLLLDQTYLYSHLSAPPASGHTGTIFDNHIIRSRVNYQFTRELSVRGIVDYNGVLSNPSLVALDRTKHVTADVLLTYLLNPGTAIYVGVTDGFDNLALDPITGIRTTSNPTTSTGRQFFVKTSYLFRF